MLVKHLQLFEIKVAFLELYALLVVLRDQALLLAPHLNLSQTLLFDLLELLCHPQVFLFDVALNLLDFLSALLLALLRENELFLVALLGDDAGVSLFLFILVEGLLAGVQFLEQLALAHEFFRCLPFLECSSLGANALVVDIDLLAHAESVHSRLFVVGLHF